MISKSRVYDHLNLYTVRIYKYSIKYRCNKFKLINFFFSKLCVHFELCPKNATILDYGHTIRRSIFKLTISNVDTCIVRTHYTRIGL